MRPVSLVLHTQIPTSLHSSTPPTFPPPLSASWLLAQFYAPFPMQSATPDSQWMNAQFCIPVCKNFLNNTDWRKYNKCKCLSVVVIIRVKNPCGILSLIDIVLFVYWRRWEKECFNFQGNLTKNTDSYLLPSLPLSHPWSKVSAKIWLAKFYSPLPFGSATQDSGWLHPGNVPLV